MNDIKSTIAYATVGVCISIAALTGAKCFLDNAAYKRDNAKTAAMLAYNERQVAESRAYNEAIIRDEEKREAAEKRERAEREAAEKRERAERESAEREHRRRLARSRIAETIAKQKQERITERIEIITNSVVRINAQIEECRRDSAQLDKIFAEMRKMISETNDMTITAYRRSAIGFDLLTAKYALHDERLRRILSKYDCTGREIDGVIEEYNDTIANMNKNYSETLRRLQANRVAYNSAKSIAAGKLTESQQAEIERLDRKISNTEKEIENEIKKRREADLEDDGPIVKELKKNVASLKCRRMDKIDEYNVANRSTSEHMSSVERFIESNDYDLASSSHSQGKILAFKQFKADVAKILSAPDRRINELSDKIHDKLEEAEQYSKKLKSCEMLIDNIKLFNESDLPEAEAYIKVYVKDNIAEGFRNID